MNPSAAANDKVDWIDATLRADATDHASGYLDDAGFTARVMAGLPPAMQPLPPWRKPAVALMWTIAGAGAALALPGVAVDVGREAFRLLATQPVSLPQIAAAFVFVGIATWGAAAYALKSD